MAQSLAERPEGGTDEVDWPDPAHAALWWTWDQMHNPRPDIPYTASIECGTLTRGSTAASQAIGVPMQMHAATLRGYRYNATALLDEDIESWLPGVRGAVIGELNGLLERWESVFLPEVLRLNAELREFDYASASHGELVAQIERSVAIRERMWEIHMRVVSPVIFAAGALANMWAQAFGEERTYEAHELLQGFPNKSIEAAAELWKLSREAMTSPAVARLIEETPARRVVAQLRTSADGRAFLAKLDAYLQAYGWRSGALEYADPSWIEEPSIALTTLRDYIRQPDEKDPAYLAAGTAAAREALLARVGPEVDALPQAAMLRATLQFAQQYLPIQENHNFYIDQMNTVLMRLPALEAGRRLAAADALALPEDVFWLTVSEVKEALVAPPARSWPEMVAERRAAWAVFAEAPPPFNLGTPLAASLTDNPDMTGFRSFFGEPVLQDEHSNILRGAAASRGTYTGTARVIMTLDDADRLQPGEVLVCPMTMPAWTPLFAVAGAVVTDSGGATSHSAIVAREYRIPAVTGASGGTRRIADGQRITVNGYAGTVTLHS